MILLNYITMLQTTWINNRRYFDGTDGAAFLGTQLVKISRRMEVIAESVEQARFALRSVYISDAEQQTIQLRFVQDNSVMTLAELLDWLERSSIQEWPHLLREGGKDGATAIVPSLEYLAILVNEVCDPAVFKGNNPGLPEAIFKRRVRTAFEELRFSLDAARAEAEIVGRKLGPKIDRIVFNVFSRTQAKFKAKIEGSKFRQGATVDWINVNNTVVTDAVTDTVVYSPIYIEATFNASKLTSGQKTTGSWSPIRMAKKGLAKYTLGTGVILSCS
jgi:hypothetical protein